jgi:tape measure domain-containing protein
MGQAAQATGAVGEAAAKAGSERTAMQRLGEAARGVGRTMAAVTTVAVGGMVALAAATVATGISYNSLEQNTRAALTTLMGGAEAATDQMNKLREFVRTALFPREVFIEGQQQLLAFGFAAESVIPTLDAVQQAVAATGGSAQTFREVVSILAEMQSTSQITAGNLNELGRRGINAAQLIGAAMGKTENEIRESISSGALDGREAIDLLVNAMESRFAGAAALISNTWVGAAGLVTAALRDIGSVAVSPFIDPLGGGAAVVWAQNLAEVLYALQRQVEALVGIFRSSADPTFAAVADRLLQLAAAIDEIDLEQLLDRMQRAAPVLAGMGAALTAAGSSAALSAVGLGSLAGVISPLGAALAAAAVASPELRQVLVDLLEAVAPLVPNLLQLAETLAVALSSGVGELTALVSPLVEVLDILLDVFMLLPGPVQQATLAVAGFAIALRFGGPVGVALAAVATLGAAVETLGMIFGENESNLRVWRSTIAETAEDLERLGRTGELAGDLKQAEGAFRDFAAELGNAHDDLNAFEEIQRRLADIPPDWMPAPPWQEETPRIRETSEVLAEFADRFSSVDQALGDMVAAGDVEAAAAAFIQLGEMAEAAGISHEDLLALFPEYARQLERHKVATDDAAEEQGGFAQEVTRATEALREQHDALRAQVDPIFALFKALQELDEAQAHYNEVLDDSESSQSDVEAASIALAEASLGLQGAVGEAAGAFGGELTPAFRATLEAANLTEEQIDAVEEAMRGAAEAGEDYEGDYAARLIANGVDNTLARIELVRQRLAAIDRTVTISFETRGFAPVDGVRIPGQQHGGPIDWGQHGVDRVPALLTRGEHVWTAREVDAAGGHQAVEALRAAVLAGATRFATGGPVGVSGFQRGGEVAGGGGGSWHLTGDLRLSTGEFLGVVSGVVSQVVERHDADLDRMVTQGTGAAR